jgi:hypothetical protein
MVAPEARECGRGIGILIGQEPDERVCRVWKRLERRSVVPCTGGSGCAYDHIAVGVLVVARRCVCACTRRVENVGCAGRSCRGRDGECHGLGPSMRPERERKGAQHEQAVCKLENDAHPGQDRVPGAEQGLNHTRLDIKHIPGIEVDPDQLAMQPSTSAPGPRHRTPATRGAAT